MLTQINLNDRMALNKWHKGVMSVIVRKKKEFQRYGRNKDTIINHTYINSGDYRNKFNKISNDIQLNRLVYQVAKKMLKHRSGTLLEDMYWIDINTKSIVASEITQEIECEIRYSKSTQRAIKNNKNLLVIHTHPFSMPPSIRDLNSALSNGYRICIVCCHNGKVFMYQSNRHVIEFFYKGTVAKYKKWVMMTLKHNIKLYLNINKRVILFLRRCDMRVHEKDTELKIPNWYLKLPQSIINCISDLCIVLSHLLTKRKVRKDTDCKGVKFLL